MLNFLSGPKDWILREIEEHTFYLYIVLICLPTLQ